jgi:two-component system NtrC family sensor kinase
MTALNIMASALESRQSSSETQLMMVKSICKILKAEQGMLVILDEDQNEFAIVTIYDTLKEQVHQESRPIEEGLVVTCIRDSRIILVNKVTGDEGLNLRFDVPNATPVRSLLCCPLNASNNSLGAILVFNQEQGGFSQLDRELMASMASALANTAFNLRLIQQLKLANADLEASRWELLRSRNTLRALFDNIPSSFYIIDRHYGLIAINMSRADRANSKPNLMVGRKCHQVLYGRAEPCPGCKVADTLFGGHATSRVDRSWIANDQFMEWEINTYPIYDVANQPVQAILVEQDITEKRRLEVSLAQSEKLAAVGQLAAGVAHEINNPLAAIIANAQILARDLPKDDDLQESVKLIQMAGSRASQVVRNLLGLARKENYEFLPVDLNDTIRNSLMLLQHEFVSRPVDLIFDLADDLPRIIASRDHLQGVWINLMLNAFDALEGAPGEVRITTRKQGNEFRITIADTGKGIPPDKVSRIFEPFYTTKEAGRGTGLGLSLCHRIIKQHGGYILVESQVGAGTKFIVVLPGTSEPSS